MVLRNSLIGRGREVTRAEMISFIYQQKELVDKIANGPLSPDGYKALHELDDIIQPLDVKQILFDEIAALKSEVERLKEGPMYQLMLKQQDRADKLELLAENYRAILLKVGYTHQPDENYNDSHIDGYYQAMIDVMEWVKVQLAVLSSETK